MTHRQNLAIFETEERFLLFKLFNQIPTIEEFSFTQGKICYDASILTADKSILAEAKVRSFPASKYDEYILQVDKLISLGKKAKQVGYKAYYVNFFQNEDCNKKDFIIFDLSERIKIWKENPPETKKMYMNKETFISTTNKIEKDVIMIKFDPSMDCRGTINLN